MSVSTEENTDLHGLDAPLVWDTASAYHHLRAQGRAESKRTAERRLNALRLLPEELTAASLRDERGQPANTPVLDWAIAQARSRRKRVLFARLADLPTGQPCLHANDARGTRYWIPLQPSQTDDSLRAALCQLHQHLDKEIAVFPHGTLVGRLRCTKPVSGVSVHLEAYSVALDGFTARPAGAGNVSPHLKRLEDESIHILREAVAEAQNPVMLYSVGKDSGVMLHLARKAFYPSRPPFPLLHVDTRWKFQEMYRFRDQMAKHAGMDLLVHINPEAIEKNINPFDHGSSLHTDMTKTVGLKQALDHYRFDVVFGGARRDEEKSRAKERIFSFRSATHRWDPKNQRPELWDLYNTRTHPGESIRVFPLSNWTELDVWQYIYQEGIPVVPLYFAKPRPVWCART